MTSETTSRALLLEQNKQIADMREDMGKLLAGLAHVVDRQKDFSGNNAAIEQRLEAGSRRHAEFAATLAAIDVRLEVLVEVPVTLAGVKAELDKVVPAVAEMKPQVKDLMDWKARVAAQTVVASAIVGSALWFIWEGLKWFFPHPKELFDRLFH